MISNKPCLYRSTDYWTDDTLGVDFRFNIILLQIKQQWDWGIKLSQLVDCPFPTLITTHNNDNKSAIYTNIVGHGK